MKDTTTYAPFWLCRIEGEHFLILEDEAMLPHMDVFDDMNREGNGYDWTDVAVALIRGQEKALESLISFDPEAGAFTAQGELEALKRLASLLHVVAHDHDRLREVLKDAPAEWM